MNNFMNNFYYKKLYAEKAFFLNKKFIYRKFTEKKSDFLFKLIE